MNGEQESMVLVGPVVLSRAMRHQCMSRFLVTLKRELRVQLMLSDVWELAVRRERRKLAGKKLVRSEDRRVKRLTRRLMRLGARRRLIALLYQALEEQRLAS
jgi:hypothetical protein